MMAGSAEPGSCRCLAKRTHTQPLCHHCEEARCETRQQKLACTPPHRPTAKECRTDLNRSCQPQLQSRRCKEALCVCIQRRLAHTLNLLPQTGCCIHHRRFGRTQLQSHRCEEALCAYSQRKSAYTLYRLPKAGWCTGHLHCIRPPRECHSCEGARCGVHQQRSCNNS